MPDTASLAHCIVEDIRKVSHGIPVILLPGRPGEGPRFVDDEDLCWDRDDEPATVVKFSRAVQALRGEASADPGTSADPGMGDPRKPAPAEVIPAAPMETPAALLDEVQEPTGEVPGLCMENDVWKMGNPEWDIWMFIPEDEAPTRVLPGRDQEMCASMSPLDPLPALGDETLMGSMEQRHPDPLGLEILEETIRRAFPEIPSDIPDLVEENDVELVYLLKKKKKK